MNTDLRTLLKKIAEMPIHEEKKKEIASAGESLIEKVERHKQVYGSRTDEDAVKESENLEKEIESFVQKGYDSLKAFGKDLKNGIRKIEENEGGLIISDYHNIFVWIPTLGVTKIFDMPSITDICIFDDKLYAMVYGWGIFTVPDKENIWKCLCSTSNLEKHNDSLCIGISNNNSPLAKIAVYKILPKEEKLFELSGQYKQIENLCSHNNELYFVLDSQEIFKGNKKIAKRTYTKELCSHEGKLYDGGDYGVCETSDALCRNPLITDDSSALCSYENVLYSSNEHRTWNVLAKKQALTSGYAYLYSTPKWLIGINPENSRLLLDALTGKTICTFKEDLSLGMVKILPAPDKVIKNLLEIK